MTKTLHKTLSDEAILNFLDGLWRFNRRLKQDVEPLLLERYGLDIRRYFILSRIESGLCYPKQLSELLDIPATLLSRYLEQLSSAGLIERQIDPQDSRRTLLSLSAEGQETLQGCLEAVKQVTGQRLGQLDPQQLDVLLQTIGLLNSDEFQSKENK